MDVDGIQHLGLAFMPRRKIVETSDVRKTDLRNADACARDAVQS
jgi:hypothetical protein